jgi:hypothetical protein
MFAGGNTSGVLRQVVECETLHNVKELLALSRQKRLRRLSQQSGLPVPSAHGATEQLTLGRTFCRQLISCSSGTRYTNSVSQSPSLAANEVMDSLLFPTKIFPLELLLKESKQPTRLLKSHTHFRKLLGIN